MDGLRRAAATVAAIITLSGAAHAASFNLDVFGGLTRDLDGSSGLDVGGAPATTRITGSFSASAQTDGAGAPALYAIEGEAEGPISESISTTAVLTLTDFGGVAAAFGFGGLFSGFLGDVAAFFLTDALPELAKGGSALSDDEETLSGLFPSLPGDPSVTFSYAVTGAAIDLDDSDSMISAMFDFELVVIEDIVGLGAAALGLPNVGELDTDYRISASVQPVPIPAALPLLLGGLGALGFASLGRRR